MPTDIAVNLVGSSEAVVYALLSQSIDDEKTARIAETSVLDSRLDAIQANENLTSLRLVEDDAIARVAVVQTAVDVEKGRVDTINLNANLASLRALENDYTGKFSTLLDSGASLDTISELKTAWEGGDGSLQSTLNSAIALKRDISTSYSAGEIDSKILIVQNDVNANEVSWTAADNALDARLDIAEAKSSFTDPTTQTLLDAESSTRASADTALDARLDIAEAKSSFTDPTTQTLLAAESSTRAAADVALDARLDIAEAKSSFTDPTTQTLLAAESSTRAAADVALDARLDIAEAKSSFTDPTTQTLLAAESTARAAADALKRNISDSYTKTQIDSSLAAKEDNLTFGIVQTNALKVVSQDATSGDFCVFAAAGIRPYAKNNFKQELDLENCENTADSAKPVSSAQQTALNLKANIASPTFTGSVTMSHVKSVGAHLKLQTSTNDLNIFLNDQETLQITRSGTEARFTVSGGSGQARFMGNVAFNGNLNSVTSTELGYVSGVSSAIQTQLGTKAPSSSPTFTDTIQFDDSATFSANCIVENQKSWRFKELASNGTKHVAVHAPNQLSDNVEFVLPADEGDADQLLSTDGSGVTSWVDAAGGDASFPLYKIDGEDFDSSRHESNDLPFPIMELQTPYYVANTASNASCFMRLPDYDASRALGSWIQIYNGGNTNVYVATFQYGLDNSGSSDQKVYSERYVGGGNNQGVITSSNRNSKVILISRESDIERWLIAYSY